jgi:ABC-type dipeptide/oligopeptide/nickel transport system permease component
MQRYVAGRVLQAFAALFALSVVVFVLGRAIGDPLNRMLSLDATQEQREEMRRELGLDRPLHIQYVTWLGNVMQGDLGESIKVRRPVGALIAERLPNSVKLAAVAMGLALLISLPLGILAAVKKGSWLDTFAKLVAVFGLAAPSFWVGIMLIILFSVHLGWLPTSGMGSPLSYVMPAFTLGASTITAGMIRLMRSSMLEVLDTEYMKLARIKGMSEVRAVFVHALRNALIPLLTLFGMYFALLVGTAVVVETVFAWPGLGRLAFDALTWKDFPLIQGILLLVAALMLAANLIVDVLCAYIDPRIRY